MNTPDDLKAAEIFQELIKFKTENGELKPDERNRLILQKGIEIKYGKWIENDTEKVKEFWKSSLKRYKALIEKGDMEKLNAKYIKLHELQTGVVILSKKRKASPIPTQEESAKKVQHIETGTASSSSKSVQLNSSQYPQYHSNNKAQESQSDDTFDALTLSNKKWENACSQAAFYYMRLKITKLERDLGFPPSILSIVSTNIESMLNPFPSFCVQNPFEVNSQENVDVNLTNDSNNDD